MSPLAKKLQLRPGMKVALVNAPAGIADKLRPLPDGVKISRGAARDAVIGFAQDSAELQETAPEAIKATRPDGLLWLCYPKGGAKARTDLNRDILRETVDKRYGFEGVSLVAVDETWSAMRFLATRKGATKS